MRKQWAYLLPDLEVDPQVYTAVVNLGFRYSWSNIHLIPIQHTCHPEHFLLLGSFVIRDKEDVPFVVWVHCDVLTLMYRKREQNLLSCFLLSASIVWPATSPTWFRFQEPLCKTVEVLQLLYSAAHREVFYLTTLSIVKEYTAPVVCE